jgi:ABC-2 type transport system ATP-binding protein
MPAIVEIEQLTKDYEVGFWRKKKVRALDGLSLQVNEGEIFGFLGANGAGKTTTLKLLMRLMFPTSGNGRILGRDISDLTMHNQIGYLPENPYFYDYLTAREILDYCGQLFGIPAAKRKEKTANLLTRVNLDSKSWNVQLRKFSKGMLQRVGLAQALVNDPVIVFLDEPMSGLDPVGRREVRDLIAGLRQEGKTVFMNSHILSDIEVLCDRVAILKRGKLAHVGQLDELRRGISGSADDRLEVVVTGTEAKALAAQLTSKKDFQITTTPSGLRVEVPEQEQVDEVISALRRAGGKLVSVQPLRQSLEDLFVDPQPKTPSQS